MLPVDFLQMIFFMLDCWEAPHPFGQTGNRYYWQRQSAQRVTQWFLPMLRDSHTHFDTDTLVSFLPSAFQSSGGSPASFLTPTQPIITLALHILHKSLPYCQAPQLRGLDWQLLLAAYVMRSFLVIIWKVLLRTWWYLFPPYETHSSRAHSLHPADSPQARATVKRGKGKAWCSQAENTTLDNRGHLIFHPPPFPTYVCKKIN